MVLIASLAMHHLVAAVHRMVASMSLLGRVSVNELQGTASCGAKQQVEYSSIPHV